MKAIKEIKNSRCELFSITNIINFIAENMAISCRNVFKGGKKTKKPNTE